MVAYLKIDCGYCGRSWDVYDRADNLQADTSRKCPHCGAKIERVTWANYVVPAFRAVRAANLQLANDHAEIGYPLFSFGVVPDGILKV